MKLKVCVFTIDFNFNPCLLTIIKQKVEGRAPEAIATLSKNVQAIDTFIFSKLC